MTSMARAVDEAFAVVRQTLADPHAFPDNAVIIPIHSLIDDPRSPLSRERLRLLDMVRTEGPFASITLLAHALHRPRTRVGDDVGLLRAAGLLRTRRCGRDSHIEATQRIVVLA